MISAWDSLFLPFKPYWIPKEDERSMFARWDKIYSQIRLDLQNGNLIKPVPADAADIHRGNVIPRLRVLHGSRRTIKIGPTS
jgi:hypothetical protein